MSFLSKFKSFLHAVEAIASITAPIVAAVDPVMGALVTQATQAAIGAEAAITAPGSGPQKAQIVADQTKATVAVINAIRASQGQSPLPANITDVVAAQVGVAVAGLNAAAKDPVTKDPAAA